MRELTAFEFEMVKGGSDRQTGTVKWVNSAPENEEPETDAGVQGDRQIGTVKW